MKIQSSKTSLSYTLDVACCNLLDVLCLLAHYTAGFFSLLHLIWPQHLWIIHALIKFVDIRSWGGGYLSMIWVGTCHCELKSWPSFIPNFAEKWDPLSYLSKNKFTKNLTFFSKTAKLSSNYRNFGIRLIKLGIF